MVIFLLASAFYFFETLVDTAPSVMITPLMQGFHLSAFQLGILDVSYFALAALIQIPGGLMLDRFGARRVMPLAAVCCGFGLLIFMSAHSFKIALLGRMLAGLGSAFGILGALFMIGERIRPSLLAFGLGASIMIGLSGALLDGPMAMIAQALGWRGLILILSLSAFVFSLVFWLCLPEKSPLPSGGVERNKGKGGRLRILAKDKTLWAIALYGGIMYLPAGMLGTLWGTHFLLMAEPRLSLPEASTLNSLIFLGWIVGSPIVGALSDFFQQRRAFLILASTACLTVIALLFSLPHFNVMGLIALFFGLGFFGSFSGLTFAMGIERYSKCRALTVGWINLFAIVPMLIMNPMYGQFLDRLGFASLHADQVALWPIMILLGLSVFLSLCIEKTA